MSGRNVTRKDLIKAVFKEIGLSHNESAALVESVLEQVVAALARGEQVKLAKFGTFSVRQKQARVGRNPRTGEEKIITARRVPAFRASSHFKAAVETDNPVRQDP